MKTVTINGKQYSIDAQIEHFSINQKPSSNVDFYGVNAKTGELFVQFKGGSSYIYSGITADVAIELINCESIGKYVSQSIVCKFPSRKVDGRLVFQAPLQAVNSTDFGSNND